MSRKRKSRLPVQFIVEGHRESALVQYLALHKKGDKVHVKQVGVPTGGTAKSLIDRSIKESGKTSNSTPLFTLFDEDFAVKMKHDIEDGDKDFLLTLERLASCWKTDSKNLLEPTRDLRHWQRLFNTGLRNPIFVIGFPHSVDGTILRLLGNAAKVDRYSTTSQLKEVIKGMMSNLPISDTDSAAKRDFLFFQHSMSEETVEVAVANFLSEDHGYSLVVNALSTGKVL